MIEDEILWDLCKWMDNEGWTTLRFMQADKWQRIQYFKIHINKWLIEAEMLQDLCKQMDIENEMLYDLCR